MTSDPTARERTDPDEGPWRTAAEPRVLLFADAGRDRELLVESLGRQYRVDATTDPSELELAFDCCVIDRRQFGRVAEDLRRRVADAEAFLPVALLVGRDEDVGPSVWDSVDDVLRLPVTRAELTARVGNLVERRRTAVELADRTEQLEETVRELRLKERAIDEAPVGFTITEADDRQPIVYANESFEELTGYDEADFLGRDHTFLQGEGTDEEARRRFRAAIENREHVSVDVLNYRADGRKFWNRVRLAPVSDDGGTVTHFVGFQSDVTDRKIRKRRLEVLNRVLSHNLRNKMNVVEGHATILRREFDDDEVPDSLEEIENAAADLIGLAGAVADVERAVDGTDPSDRAVPLAERLPPLVESLRERYPGATFEFEVADELAAAEDACEVAVPGITTAVEEVLENAVVHSDSPEPRVVLRVDRRPDGWVEIEIEDDGPGVPRTELEVLRDGETSLHHADRLGFWLVHWILSRAGGDFSVSEADPTGTLVRIAAPPAD